MVLTKYTYDIIIDFPNNKVDNYTLYLELQSALISETLNRVDTDDNDCNIWYDNALSGPEQTVLDGYVAVHQGNPQLFPVDFADGAYFGDAVSLDSTAIVEMDSTEKGLLIPRMTTVQRNAITSPAAGLLIYDTDLNSLMSYDNSSWEAQRDAKQINGIDISGTVADGYGLKYNSITGDFEYEPFPRVFSVADGYERIALAAVEGDEAVQLDENSQWIYNGTSWIKRSGYYAHTITVSSSGAQFTSIKDAIEQAVAEGASASQAFLVDVYPGTYFEDPMTVPSGVLVNGLTNNMFTVVVIANNANEDLFTCTGGTLAGIEISGVSDVAKALVRCSIVDVLVVLHGVSFQNCSQGLVVSNGASALLTNVAIALDGLGQSVTTGLTVTGSGSYIGISGGYFSVPSALIPFYASNPIQTVIRVADSGRLVINAATFSVAYKTTDADVFLCDGGSATHILSCEIRDGGTGAHIGSSGTNTTIKVQGGIWENNNLNGKSDSSTGIFLVSAAADDFKFEPVAGTILSGFIQSQATARSYLVGDASYRFSSGKEADLEEFFHDQASTGLAYDGYVTDGGGLFADVFQGHGWVVRHGITPHDVFDVAWDGYMVPLIANVTNHVVYDSATEGLIAQVATPSESQILLATAVTDSTDIRFLHQTRRIVHNTTRILDDYLLQTRKIALKSGLNVTAGSDGYKIDVDSGSWYRATDEITYTGATDALFSYFYGANGVSEIASQTDFDDGYYDDSGVLTSLSDGYYKTDTVYVTSDGRISVIYGTSEYETLVLATAALTANSPTFIQETACVLANVICEKNAGIVDIIDKRPDPNAATAATGGGGGVTAHGALSGLANDDHTQYLLGSGSRAMSGNLNLGSNNITTVGTVDGVTVSAHASRHNPGAIDALTTAVPVATQVGASPAEGVAASYARSDHQHGVSTGTPVTIATTNSAGSASTAARSDHVHAHGNQTVGTLHAVATIAVSGFMSAVDKTKLDGVASGATNTPLSSTSPVNVTKAAASAGSASEASRQDHKHDVTTAAAVGNPPGTSNAEGSGTSLARADHTHALASFGTTLGTFCQGNDSRLSDDRTASALRTTTGTVNVSASSAPTLGQILIATSGVAATWQDLTTGETLAVTQARRTTSLAVPGSWADITFDTTDVETDGYVIEHDPINTDRILIKESDTYEIKYQFEISPVSTGTFSGRVRKNDSIVIPGSFQSSITYSGESDIISISVAADLAANDYLSVQNQLTTSGTMSTNATFSVLRLSGAKGDTGSGSNVTLQDEGINVPNTPHSTLNFTGAGVEVTDSGSGVAQIEIAGGDGYRPKSFEVVETTGGQSLVTLTTVTFDGTPSPDEDVFSWDGTDELTILEAGNVYLCATMGVQQTAGGGRTITSAFLELQPDGGGYALMAGSTGLVYTRNNSDGNFGSIVCAKMYTAAVDDKIRLRAAVKSGTGTIVDLVDTSLIAIWLPLA